MFDTEIVDPSERVLGFLGDESAPLIADEVGYRIAQRHAQGTREPK